MVPSILAALARIKADVAAHLKAATIERLCREVGHTWRDRLLGPVVTVHAFLLQVLHANTACDDVPHLTGGTFTGAAYCQARKRLPPALFERLLADVGGSLAPCRDEAERWCGHRVWHLDGSGFSMPDTPELQKAFGQPGTQEPGCGFPVAHALTLFHAGTGMLQKALTAPLRTHDLRNAWRMHPEMQPDDVLVGDRAFGSYAHLAQLREAGLHGVFRLHQRTIVNFRKGRVHRPPHLRGYARKFFRGATGLPRSRWVRWLGQRDQLVEYYKPAQCPKWMTPEAYAALPDSLVVRELRFEVLAPGCRVKQVTLVTTLLDAERHPAAELAQAYFDRWQAEVNLRHLKQTLKLDVLRSKTVDGVAKELCMIALAYNLVRLVMVEAARRQRVLPCRVSFVDALRWLRNARPGEPLRKLIVHRIRPRCEPRVRKRRPKQYDLMNKPRATMRKQLLHQ
ncbi:MAG: IS4 family transposase [Pseudonocardia sp.]|nr:IS4 family transposase [Pseudonocardia sp.]